MSQNANNPKEVPISLTLPEGRSHDILHPELSKETIKKRSTKNLLSSVASGVELFFEEESDLYTEIKKELKAKTNSDTYSPKLKTRFGYLEAQYKVNAQAPSHYYFRNKKKYLILDENLYSKNGFFSLGELVLNHGEYMAAYALDFSGNENYEIHIKDFISPTRDTIVLRGKYAPTIEFSYDDKVLYLLKYDKVNRPYQIVAYNINENKYNIIFTEDRPGYTLSFSNARDERHLIITSTTSTSNEVKILTYETNQITPFSPPENITDFSIDIYQGVLFLLAENQDNINELYAKTFSHWEKLHTFTAEENIEDFTIFESYLVIEGRKNGFQSVATLNPRTKKLQWVASPKMKTTRLYASGLPTDRKFITTVDGWTTPTQYYSFEMNDSFSKFTKKFLAQDKIKKFDSKKYREELLTFTASDGTLVPISLLSPRKGKTTYLWVEAYGAYGHSLDPELDFYQATLLDRGISIATIHARGGGEFGKKWHAQGKLQNKKNTFTDIDQGLRHLIEKGITEPGKVIIRGGSAGAMACASAMLISPDLYLGAILNVPFLDVLTTMLQPELPLTIGEYEEWGNPSLSVADFDYIKSYSPIDQLKKEAYPSILMTAGLSDYRVGYWEPMRFYTKYKSMNTNDQTNIYLRYYEGGHNMSLDRDSELQEGADMYTFAISLVEKHKKEKNLKN